jgi:hypothetical protein
VGLGQEGSAGGSLEDLANTLVGSRRALEVLVGTDLLANFLTLLGGNGLLRGLGELLDCLGVMTEILLASDEDDRETLAEVKNFRDPLLLNVVERVR